MSMDSIPPVPGLVEIEPHATNDAAIQALRGTLDQLGSFLHESEGRYWVPDGYPAWACERQGYVRRVLRPTNAHPEPIR